MCKKPKSNNCVELQEFKRNKSQYHKLTDSENIPIALKLDVHNKIYINLLNRL